MIEYRPIETAPRNGTPVLLWTSFQIPEAPTFHPIVARWNRAIMQWEIAPSGFLKTDYSLKPTHWAPLPQPVEVPQ